MEHMHDNTESSKSGLTGQDVHGKKKLAKLHIQSCLVCNDHRHMAYTEVLLKNYMYLYSLRNCDHKNRPTIFFHD
jgi:hypothetical protein